MKMTDVEAAEAGRRRPGNLDAQDLALQCLARVNDNAADAQDPVKHPEVYEFCEKASMSRSWLYLRPFSSGVPIKAISSRSGPI